MNIKPRYVYDDVVAYIKEHAPRYFLHGCNCYSVMGAGVAGALARAWPSVPEADKNFMKNHSPVMKLANYSMTAIKEYTIVVNLYTQVHAGPDEFNLRAFSIALEKVIIDATPKAIIQDNLVMPRIGCGLARNPRLTQAEAWNIVELEIKFLFNRYQIPMNKLIVIGTKEEDPNK